MLQVTNSDNGRYNLTVKSSNDSLFSNSVLYFNIVIEGNGEPPGTSGLSTGAIAGIIAGVVVVILCAAGYGVYRWRRGSQKKSLFIFFDLSIICLKSCKASLCNIITSSRCIVVPCTDGSPSNELYPNGSDNHAQGNAAVEIKFPKT